MVLLDNFDMDPPLLTRFLPLGASGFGINQAGPNRCYEAYQEFRSCVLTSLDGDTECLALLEDFNECLYHKKEIARARLVNKQILEKRQAKGDARDFSRIWGNALL